MIKKIVLNNVTSYKNVTSLETDKKTNLIYGLNGTGKSTLSDFLYDPMNPRFSNCMIDGLEDTDEVLVYNQHFISDVFYETEEINGIFTLAKENAEAKIAIEKAQNEWEQVKFRQTKKTREKEDIKSELERRTDEIYNETWKIKTKYSGGDRILEYCLDGLKRTKATLFEYIISVQKGESKPDITIVELMNQAKILKGDSLIRRYLDEITFDMKKIEESPIFSKVIVGNKNSSVSALIDKLGNSDWVKDGLEFVKENTEEQTCPFCQSKTLTNDIIKNINAYFDDSYQDDLKEIDNYYNQYKDCYESIPSKDDYMSGECEKKYSKDFELIYNRLVNQIESNIGLMFQKSKTPSAEISIKSTALVIDELNKIIKSINKDINSYNQRIKNREKNLIETKEIFWTIMRWEFDHIIESYQNYEIEQNKKIGLISEEERQLKEKILELNNFISEKQRQTINIDEAITNINHALIEIGIDDFKIEKSSDEKALYYLKRENNTENIFKSLSEGEKMVISFLYFIELCKGKRAIDSRKTDKIVVIDDPISSLSHIHVFNIGRLIHNEFLRNDKYNQIFILTHSLYFFYELTCTNHKERKDIQALFRLQKNNEGSSILKMKYEEIQNDYQSYWYIVRDKSQPPALIANCMRNIIEYFFNFVEHQDLNTVFDKAKLKSNKFAAFNRYMNRESHSKGQNIFDIKEFDYDNFKEAFKSVFINLGYELHYNKMMS